MVARHVLMANGSLQGGGAERVIATLSRHLRAMGHRVSIAALSSGGEVLDELRAEGFDIVNGLSRTSMLGIPAVASRLGRLAADRGIDIVHTHDLRSLIDVGACRRLVGRFGHVHTFHFGNYPHLPRKYLLAERAFARAPDRLVAVGRVQREGLAVALRLRVERVQVVWNGVDAPAARARSPESTGAPREVPTVGSVSAFFPQKGLSTLLEAAGIARSRGLEFRLRLVGDGPLRAELEATALRLGLAEVVEFAGWVPDASTSVMPSLDVFVQSSYWEAMSVVILEAMAAGVPILATAVGENPRVLANGETGLLVRPGDAQALAGGLVRLLQDAELRRRLSRAAERSYEAEFTAEIMASRYAAVYEQVLTCR